MRSVWPKICGATTWPSSCCSPTNSSATHSARDRVGEQRHEHRRERAEDRADVGDQLHHAEEHPERDAYLRPSGKIPSTPNMYSDDAGGGAHDRR